MKNIIDTLTKKVRGRVITPSDPTTTRLALPQRHARP